MRITVFNGSPAGKNSATHKMVQEILTGAIDEGVGAYRLELHMWVRMIDKGVAALQ